MEAVKGGAEKVVAGSGIYSKGVSTGNMPSNHP